MTRNDIITLPNVHLRQRSQRVGIVSDEIKQLVADMESATLDWEAHRDHEVGVALAAVQIDRLYRVIVIRKDFNDKDNHEFSVFINPEVTKCEGALVEDYEGCLSVRDMYGKVPRYERVRVKALNLEGKEVRVTVNGFLARIFQHEIDHTNGKLFIDHIKGKTDAFYRLNDEGKLEPLDYDTVIRHSKELWDDDEA